MIMDYIESNPMEFIDSSEIEKVLKYYPRKKDYWQTPWGIMLNDPSIKDPTSRIAKLFKRRFRLSFHLFAHWLVPEANRVNLFDIIDIRSINYLSVCS